MARVLQAIDTERAGQVSESHFIKSAMCVPGIFQEPRYRVVQLTTRRFFLLEAAISIF